MRTPVFRFEAEVLSDAPVPVIETRLREGGPEGFRALRAFKHWHPLVIESGEVRLSWSRRVAGAEERGSLIVRPDPKGSHLRLEGRLKGWSAFLLLGWLRWRTDRLLDRVVEEL